MFKRLACLSYDMLSSCLPYSNFITLYYNRKSNDLLNDDDSNNCIIIHKLLKPFNSAAEDLSRQYYPTSFYLLPNLFKITIVFVSYRDAPCFQHIIAIMEQKYNFYWNEPPMWYCLTIIMDPKYKLC